MASVEKWWVFAGFEIREVASGLDLPVSIAFAHRPADESEAPLCYVAERGGRVKAITRDRTVHTYAADLLNYRPGGAGHEAGISGLCVEPERGDVYASLVYAKGGERYGKVVRMRSSNGMQAHTIDTILDNIPLATTAHQVHAVTFGPDRMLYVNVGDGGVAEAAQDLADLRGKILRLNPHGAVPPDNPMHGSPVFAMGFRNPHGAAWRASDGTLYVSIDGPDGDDVIARVRAGANHGWPITMRKNAAFVWEYKQGPTDLAFAEGGVFGREYEDDLFVALFGNPETGGTRAGGRKIVKLKLNASADAIQSYDEFVSYAGDGPASPLGLAFGPDGLYFTDPHGEADGNDYTGAGSIYRVSRLPRHAMSALGGTIVAESDNYELVESHVYFPPDSVNWSLLVKNSHTETNTRLGTAVYWDMAVGDRSIENVAWSYPEPRRAAAHIKDYLAFERRHLDVRTERSSRIG
jgi:glucose/arabinose dehydrogenase